MCWLENYDVRKEIHRILCIHCGANDMSILESFKKNGFIHLKKILNKGQVLNLRSKIINDLSENFQGYLGVDYILKVPELAALQFNENILKVLNEICNEDIYFINDLNLQINNANNKDGKNGWHIDANSEVARFVNYLFSNKYNFFKIGIYLQDNTALYGGGIDIELKGHKSFRNFRSNKLNYLLYYFDRFFIKYFRKKIILPIEAGDCIIFDSRLPHASSTHSINKNNIPNEFKKITLYWDVAGNLNDAENFIENSMIRALKIKGPKEISFLNYLRYNYPSSYEDWYVKLVDDSKKIKIFSLEKSISELFDKYYKDIYDEKIFIEHNKAP